MYFVAGFCLCCCGFIIIIIIFIFYFFYYIILLTITLESDARKLKYRILLFKEYRTASQNWHLNRTYAKLYRTFWPILVQNTS